MNEKPAVIRLRDAMRRPDGWGCVQGRAVFDVLCKEVNNQPTAIVFRVSFADVARLDASFASETIVKLAVRFRKSKGFCMIDLSDNNIIENINLAAIEEKQPIFYWIDGTYQRVGIQPAPGLLDALSFTIQRCVVRSSDFVKTAPSISSANASMKFKTLWELGFLMRTEGTAPSGGIEYVYSRIG